MNEIETNFDGFAIEGDRQGYHLRLVRKLVALRIDQWQPSYRDEALGMATNKATAAEWLAEDQSNGIVRGPRPEDFL